LLLFGASPAAAQTGEKIFRPRDGIAARTSPNRLKEKRGLSIMHMRKRVQALALLALCGAASAGLTIGSRVEVVGGES
jgi:hypothetical protein